MEFIAKLFYCMWGLVGISVLVLVLPSIINQVKKLKKFIKEKKEKKKLTKDTSKKQIRKHNKKKDAIGYDALKFEYSDICNIVNDVAVKEGVSSALVSGVYILKFDEYFKKKNAYNDKFGDMNSLDTLACLVKALIEEPIVMASNGSITNLNIIHKVIEEFSRNAITYNKLKLATSYKKEDLLVEMQDNFRLYGDDIFLIALYLIDKIYG